RIRANRTQDFDPRSPRHLEVEENQIGKFFLNRGQQFISGLEGPDFVLVLRQSLYKCVEKHWFIVCDIDASWHFGTPFYLVRYRSIDLVFRLRGNQSPLSLATARR